MKSTGYSADVLKTWSILCCVILVSAQNIRGKSANCSGVDLCKMDEACFQFQDLDKQCRQLLSNTIYEGPGARNFSTYPSNSRLYPSRNFIVATYGIGEKLTSKQCCGVAFGELCTLEEKKEREYSLVIAVEENKELCYKDINYGTKPDETVWCCNKTRDPKCQEKFPCMDMSDGQIIWKDFIEFISLDRSYISNYCFFTATNEQATRGQQMKTLIRDVADFVLNQTSMTVVGNKTEKKCITKTIENLDSEKIAALLPRIKTSETWCFFMQGPDFTKFSFQATCLMPGALQPITDPSVDDSTRVVVIATVAILVFLLLTLVAVLYCYRYTVRNMFQKKEDTLNTIPKCTKDILKADGEFENLIETMKKPEKCHSPNGEKARTFEGYTTMSPGKKLDCDIDDQMIEKSKDVTGAIYQMKNNAREYRDRLDSGMVSDVSCDMAPHIPNGEISNDLGYSSKSPHDYRCTIMASASYDTSADSGISMTGDSGGNILHLEEQTRLSSLQIYDRDTPSVPSKYHCQLPALAEVTSIPASTVTLEEEIGTRGKLDFPIEPVITGDPSQISDGGYIEKDFLSKLVDREHVKGNMFQTSANNNYLMDSDRFHLKPTNASSFKMGIDANDPTRPLDGRMDFEVSKSGEKHQRYSDSSNDTGCGTNSYDEDEYCTKCLLEDNIMFYGDPACPNYVMKSDMENYEAQVGHLSEFQPPSSQLDSCA